jgi:cytochrome oxidase assembly protein ShyY1
MQQLAVSSRRASWRAARPLVALAAGALGLTLGLCSLKTGYSLGADWQRLSSRAREGAVLPLTRLQALLLPWQDQPIDDWEFRKVEMVGYYRPERIVVARDRDGKPGYYIFAPFINMAQQPQEGSEAIYESGVVLNLGWLPREDRAQIELGMEPTQPLEDLS